MSVKLDKRFSSVMAIFFLLPFLFNFFYLEGLQNITPPKYIIFSSKEKKFVWFRVFKVASGTIKGILKNEVLDLKESRPERVSKKFNHYFKFSFVRNPWDRVVSCYFYNVVTKKAKHFKKCFDKDFEFFVDFINELDLDQSTTHLKLQSRLIPVDELDFIGRVDNFANDFKHVCDILGIKVDEFPHKHQTQHAHYSTYYSPRTRKIIARKYKEDIKAFGFKFETE